MTKPPRTQPLPPPPPPGLRAAHLEFSKTDHQARWARSKSLAGDSSEYTTWLQSPSVHLLKEHSPLPIAFSGCPPGQPSFPLVSLPTLKGSGAGFSGVGSLLPSSKPLQRPFSLSPLSFFPLGTKAVCS